MKAIYLVSAFVFTIIFCLRGQTQNINVDSLKKLIETTANDSVKCQTAIELALYYQKENADTAIIYSRMAVANAQKGYLETYGVGSYNTLGTSFFVKGDYQSALENYFVMLRYCEKFNKKESIAYAYTNIANVYNTVKDYEKGKFYNLQSLEILQTLAENDTSKDYNLDIVYSNIAICYFKLNSLDSAKLMFQKSLTISSNIQKWNVAAKSAVNLAALFRNVTMYDSAFHYLNIAKKLFSRYNYQHEIGDLYRQYAALYLNLQKPDSAFTYLLMYDSIAIALNSLELKKNSEDLKYQYFKQKENPAEALLHHEALKKLSDSLLNMDLSKKIARYQLEYELEKMTEENLLTQQKRDAQHLYIGIILFTLLLIAILSVITLKYKEQKTELRKNNILLEKEKLELKNIFIEEEKEKLEQKINIKNKELATYVMYLVKKNEIINNIIEKLTQLKFNLKKENREEITEIVEELKLGVDDEIWQEFEVRFQTVHEDFYTKLNNEVPNLTANEKKLCAFLRLNLSTKEISTITRQSPHSIQVARTRLRKKLNLANTDISLIAFLDKF